MPQTLCYSVNSLIVMKFWIDYRIVYNMYDAMVYNFILLRVSRIK